MVTRHSQRERDFDYMGVVARLGCLLRFTANAGACEGAIQVDHAGERAGFRRGKDRDTIPLCRRHHQDRTENKGFFGTMTRTDRREWVAAAISLTRAMVDRFVAGMTRGIPF